MINFFKALFKWEAEENQQKAWNLEAAKSQAEFVASISLWYLKKEERWYPPHPFPFLAQSQEGAHERSMLKVALHKVCQLDG